MSRFAKDTSVPIERSRAQIEDVLKRYGCTAFAFGWSKSGGAMVQFEYRQRQVKLDIMPAPKYLGPNIAAQEDRRRWRVLLLWVKAQLEAIDSKLVTFEEVFLPWTLLPDGSTVAQKIAAERLLPEPQVKALNP